MANRHKMYLVSKDMSGKLISGICAGCGRIFHFEDTPEGRRIEKAFETHDQLDGQAPACRGWQVGLQAFIDRFFGLRRKQRTTGNALLARRYRVGLPKDRLAAKSKLGTSYLRRTVFIIIFQPKPRHPCNWRGLFPDRFLAEGSVYSILSTQHFS